MTELRFSEENMNVGSNEQEVFYWEYTESDSDMGSKIWKMRRSIPAPLLGGSEARAGRGSHVERREQNVFQEPNCEHT